MKEQEIRRVFDSVSSRYAGTKWVVCKLDFSQYRDEGYNYALLMYVPLDEIMDLDNYDEENQNQIQMRNFPLAREIKETLVEECQRAGIKLHIPPISVDHMTPPYITPLSVKEIGVKGGVGWIGKNDLLVTFEYGTHITTIGAVFYADEFTVGEPVTESRCGDCDLCVKACPYHNIYGNEWGPGVTRDDLVDYHKCSLVRFQIAEKTNLGRKVTCARCVLACPVGLENVEKVIHENRR